MSLTNLAQIKGGLKLQSDVAALLKSYEAAKVLTSVAKAKGANGEDNGQYNADELLQELKTGLDAITKGGAGGVSLASLKDALDGLKAKKIKDIVRIASTATYADSKFTVSHAKDFDVNKVAPATDTTVALPVYRVDNTAVFDEKGNQLTYSFHDNTFSGVPSVLDVDASKAKSDGTLVYKPIAESFEFKVFPVGEFTMENLPADSLLDNAEMQLVAYDQAINKLIVELAKDKGVIEAVKALVGEKAVQDQIKTITDALEKRILATETGKVDKTDIVTSIRDAATAEANKLPSEKAVADAIASFGNNNEITDKLTKTNERISALEGLVAPVEEKFAIAGEAASTEFALAQKPNAQLVKMVINHMLYVEGDDFTVDRETKKAKWTMTAAAGGFDINSELTDAVRFEYRTGAVVENTSTVKILHQDSIPTVGKFNVGDMVYRVTPIANSNVGWICTEAGTPGKWTTFGVVDFEHTIYPKDSASA